MKVESSKWQAQSYWLQTFDESHILARNYFELSTFHFELLIS